jgi:inosine-uridine nucleoside N-ribohydrolase
MVLDTDTYNEVDDQFAVVYALFSPEKFSVEAICAAPFFNDRAAGPAEGMQMSYEEILRILDMLSIESDGFVFRGSEDYLPGPDRPVESAAANNLIERAMSNAEQPLYVVAIGAITNVASALLMEPRIIERIVLLWLGGQPLYWPSAKHFNLKQDLHASRLVFDCGVPLIHFPCDGVTSQLITNLPEIELYVRGQGRIGDHLAETVKAYYPDHSARSKVIWDIATLAWLLNPEWISSELVHSPILTDQMTWSVDHSRHLMRNITFVRRDPIFGDLFEKIRRNANRSLVSDRTRTLKRDAG